MLCAMPHKKHGHTEGWTDHKARLSRGLSRTTSAMMRSVLLKAAMNAGLKMNATA